MQLKQWFTVALVAVVLDVATPIILFTSTATAATATALTLTVANPALAALGGGVALVGLAALKGVIIGAGARRGKRAVAGVPDDGFSRDAVDILFAAAGALDRVQLRSQTGLRTSRHSSPTARS